MYCLPCQKLHILSQGMSYYRRLTVLTNEFNKKTTIFTAILHIYVGSSLIILRHYQNTVNNLSLKFQFYVNRYMIHFIIARIMNQSCWRHTFIVTIVS